MTQKPTLQEIQAGDAFRKTMIKRSDATFGSAPLWHGWVIMDAFLAGMMWERNRPARAQELDPK
jgi:hypothetical protein